MDSIRTKRRVPNPNYDAEKPLTWENQPQMWEYGYLGRPLFAGDVVEFLCNGKGRGGHCRVFATVTKVNKKTFKAIERERSYAPGTRWTVYIEDRLESGNGGIIVDLDKKEQP